MAARTIKRNKIFLSFVLRCKNPAERSYPPERFGAITLKLYKGKYRTDSTRLKGYDYSSPGGYFVTVSTRNHTCFLGDVVKGTVELSSAGMIVAEEWQKTPQLRPNVSLDTWVVMPNHVHGIILIKELFVETHSSASPRRHSTFGPQRNNLASIIRGFKSASTKRIHIEGYRDFLWQPGFYEHIIRDGQDLDRIREYIIENPLNWQGDEDFPKNIRMDRMHEKDGWFPVD